MKPSFDVKWLMTGCAFTLSFFLSLLLFIYKSIPLPYLSQGALPDDQFFHPSLEGLYLLVLAIAFFYHTNVLHLGQRMYQHPPKSQVSLLSGWLFDSLFLYALFCYYLVVNYLGYFSEQTWVKEKIVSFFLISNPVFYGSLLLHILLNFFYSIFFQ